VVKIVETPRDGFQGLPYVIETGKKIEYINLLLKCGFNTVEVGSFVSPKIIPQMADTAKVIEGLDLTNTDSKIAVLVATEKGGQMAMQFEQVDQVFYPFSTSPTFLKKNINQTIEESVISIFNLQNLCINHNKKLVVYFSMGFDSAYGDSWSLELLYRYVEVFMTMGLTSFPFSDIFGDASPERINTVFKSLIKEYPDMEFALHLHSLAENRIAKVDAAFQAGIRQFEAVLGGLGGCPQTGKELLGNLPTGELLNYLESKNIDTGVSVDSLYLAKEYLINNIQINS